MAVDMWKGYPLSELSENFPPIDDSGIIEGQMVFLNADGKVQKAVGAQNEFAMVALNNHPLSFIDNGYKIACVQGNTSFRTDQYVTGTYTPDMRLQVSENPGEEGLIIEFQGGNAPVIGRFLQWSDVQDRRMMVVALVRE